MKYIGAILLVVLVFAIMVGGTYSRHETVKASIQLIPTSSAQPELVESTLAEYNGIYSVQLLLSTNRLQITYNKARITLEDVCHLLMSLGYRTTEGGILKAGATL
ncbi:MAG: hypothetical protein JSU61_13745 [Fidelibacterota bacterium]|nr:MAG: hypothetical protein JSU61_13745 [Candidatus Neomarinimicrobiota bacterium]